MSLHYLVQLEMLIAHMPPLNCNLYHLNCVPPNAPDLNPVDNSTWEILHEMVYKTRITELELSTMPLTNGCHNDDMIQLGPLRSQSRFQFVQISDACFIHLFLQCSHTL